MGNPTCPECAKLRADLADATIAYVEADSNRKAFLPGEPFGEADAKRQKELYQAVEENDQKTGRSEPAVISPSAYAPLTRATYSYRHADPRRVV